MTDTTTSLTDVIALADSEAVRLWSENGSIHYRSPKPISPPLASLIKTHKPALLAQLVHWDQAVALALMFEADETVAASGANARDVEIQRQVPLCMAAHEQSDMTGVRAACARIEQRVRAIRAGPNREA